MKRAEVSSEDAASTTSLLRAKDGIVLIRIPPLLLYSYSKQFTFFLGSVNCNANLLWIYRSPSTICKLNCLCKWTCFIYFTVNLK